MGDDQRAVPFNWPDIGKAPHLSLSSLPAWCGTTWCESRQLPDSTGLFRGCDVVEPAVLSIDCYFEHPADSTAVSLGDAAFSDISAILRLECVCLKIAISNEAQVHFVGEGNADLLQEQPST